MTDHAPDGSQIEQVGPVEAVGLIDAGAVLVDVREPDETAQGHAEASVPIPLSALAERIGELPADRTIVVVCRSGGRSAIATQALGEAGYSTINLAGGMEAWRDADFPVVRDNGAPGVVA